LARYEEPVSAAEAWEVEVTKLSRDRQLFRLSQVGCWLAREPGRFTPDRDEARLVVEDLFDWYERGEFDPSDVLVPISDPPYFLPVLSFVESTQDPQERTARVQEIHNLRIVEFLILRRPALKLYLSRCGHAGAPRLWRELGFDAEAPRRKVDKPLEQPDQTPLVERALSDGLDRWAQATWGPNLDEMPRARSAPDDATAPLLPSVDNATPDNTGGKTADARETVNWKAAGRTPSPPDKRRLTISGQQIAKYLDAIKKKGGPRQGRRGHSQRLPRLSRAPRMGPEGAHWHVWPATPRPVQEEFGRIISAGILWRPNGRNRRRNSTSITTSRHTP